MTFPIVDADTQFRSPWFGELTRAECRQLLSRTSVARLAYVSGSRVELVPIHIVFDLDTVYGRTAPGSRLSAIPDGQDVALEADEHRGAFDWLSVVIHGAFTVLNAEEIVANESPDLTALEKFFPNALSDEDPIPFRNQFFRIRITEMTGRYAQPTGGRRREPEPSW
jgi:nitroimidazol reductase NimA-like FMN-containing flavoprotein (pyridoxamine 5'-phosphate oxidase superfamily)